MLAAVMRLMTLIGLGGICAGIIASGGCRTAAPASTNPIRVLTYNIHHGEGLDGKVDLARIAAVIRASRADLVALQEVDKGVRRTAGRDLTVELAALTGLTGVFSNNFHYQGGEYGNAVLTRYPIVTATNLHYQMLRTNEQRGLLQVVVQIQGQKVAFWNTHVDARPDDAERRLNVTEIEAQLRTAGPLPVVLCGDFNDTPDSRVHQAMGVAFEDAWAQAGPDAGLTFSADRPRKRIDYVWLAKGGALKPVRAGVLSSDASDHRPLLVELQFR